MAPHAGTECYLISTSIYKLAHFRRCNMLNAIAILAIFLVFVGTILDVPACAAFCCAHWMVSARAVIVNNHCMFCSRSFELMYSTQNCFFIRDGAFSLGLPFAAE